MAEVTDDIAKISFLSRHSWSSSFALRTGKKEKMPTMSTMQKMQNPSILGVFRRPHIGAQVSIWSFGASCSLQTEEQSANSQITIKISKKTPHKTGEIKGLLTLQSKEQH